MNFRTEIFIPKADFKVNHRQKIAMIGSCFTNNIGDRLLKDKFNVLLNPYGILFNPISVAKAVESCVDQSLLTEDSLIYNGEKWLSLAHHSQFNQLKKQEVLEGVNASILKAKPYYNNADILIITLGTAWVYRYNNTGEYVANCHKLPSKKFTKELLGINTIVGTYRSLLKKLKEANRNMKIVFTISPIRHWKDGCVENNQSKAVLQLSVKELVEEFDYASYFPSYEIVMDELRDYRFYAKDMLHPSNVAVDYIYEKFIQTYYNDETLNLLKKINKIRSAVEHKPFNFEAESHQKFIKKTKVFMEQVDKEYPYLDFKNEFEKLLIPT